MKELTNEMKAKYFAQYWGQNVLQSKSIQPIVCVNKDWIDEVLYDSCLVLKSLELVSDEDLIEIARATCPGTSEKYLLSVGKGLMTHGCYNIQAYQYLQSRGYALPFMNLSVDQLIAAGWLQLTPNN